MNGFDAALAVGLVFAVVTGFKAGWLRSVATMLAYLIAMPIAIWAMPVVSRLVDAGSAPALQRN
jgi:membrane protein required for colicin V production